MHRLTATHGSTVSYEKHGQGAPLVLVHGSFSDHRTNWERIVPLLERRFALYAVARRGRGETPGGDRPLDDEAQDILALIHAIGEPVLLLGHSYGAHVALAAAALAPDGIRELTLYEAPWPAILPPRLMDLLTHHAQAGDWDSFAAAFFHNALRIPMTEIEELRRTPLWSPILDDAPASFYDLRALSRYEFKPERFADLRLPVRLQIGTESPRALYVTDALSGVLPNCRIEALAGQAHEAMTTAPTLYVDSLSRRDEKTRFPLSTPAFAGFSRAFKSTDPAKA